MVFNKEGSVRANLTLNPSPHREGLKTLLHVEKGRVEVAFGTSTCLLKNIHSIRWQKRGHSKRCPYTVKGRTLRTIKKRSTPTQSQEILRR
jgi:hypothetical protein